MVHVYLTRAWYKSQRVDVAAASDLLGVVVGPGNDIELPLTS